jgi:hypothetical protein
MRNKGLISVDFGGNIFLADFFEPHLGPEAH